MGRGSWTLCTQDEAPSRVGPTGRLQSGRSAKPKSPIPRLLYHRWTHKSPWVVALRLFAKDSKVRTELFVGLSGAELKPTDHINLPARCLIVFLNVIYFTKRSLLMGAVAWSQRD